MSVRLRRPSRSAPRVVPITCLAASTSYTPPDETSAPPTPSFRIGTTVFTRIGDSDAAAVDRWLFHERHRTWTRHSAAYGKRNYPSNAELQRRLGHCYQLVAILQAACDKLGAQTAPRPGKQRAEHVNVVTPHFTDGTGCYTILDQRSSPTVDCGPLFGVPHSCGIDLTDFVRDDGWSSRTSADVGHLHSASSHFTPLPPSPAASPLPINRFAHLYR